MGKHKIFEKIKIFYQTPSLIVPSSIKDLYELLDISKNKSIKTFFSEKYQEWYIKTVTSQLNQGEDPPDAAAGVKLSIIKYLHALWIIAFHKQIQSSETIIKSGFQKAK